MRLAENLRHARLRSYQMLLGPISRRARGLRMRQFIEWMQIKANDRILDLGGHPQIWRDVSIPLRLTILNLPGSVVKEELVQHEITYVEGDACDVQQIAAGDFDIIYSNSVIEHVGPEHKQQAFADQVAKFKTSFWVQTPSKWFPIEAHCGMPLWWFYPESLRQRLINRWRRTLPAWADMVEQTTYIERSTLQRLFPSAQLSTERLMGFPKSYVAWAIVTERQSKAAFGETDVKRL